MAVYKGYEVDDSLYSVIRYMPHVQAHRDELEQQQISWDYLSVMAQLANLDNELSSARQQFNHLTGILINRLGLETLQKTVNAYGFKAQETINILIRNLFERTADIGFLATDQAIEAFLTKVNTSSNRDDYAEDSAQLRKRFQQYINKYSVYDDVILLDTEGRVLVQLNQDNSVVRSKDPLIKQAMNTDEAYVEYYGPTDLLPHKKNGLIYAYRVQSADTETILGVICLCFKFENELAGIFNKLIENQSLETLVLLDKNYQVIATSEAETIPLNTSVKCSVSNSFTIVYCNGTEYLCCARSGHAYQGFGGAGWIGCVLMPIDKIFKAEDSETTFTAELLNSAMSGNLFEAETKQIPIFANQIQNELNRSVWNGNVQQASEKNGPDAAVSKVLLSEIKNTGLSTKQIFEESVSEIQKTVIKSVLKKSQSNAALAIDIMDRNLYERANDCRWWALDNTIRSLLNQPDLPVKDVKKLQSILVYINSLYTVYTNLIVFDQQGLVIAVSNEQYQWLVGSTQTADWAKNIFQLSHEEQYVVSAFEPTDLYDRKPTYIYSAAIRDEDQQKVIGGIGIVFDSEPQFLAILEDVLPMNAQGEMNPYNFAVLTDKQKNIISSTHPDYQVGDSFAIDDVFYQLEKGQSFSQVMIYHDRYYAVGCAKSLGYREYKSEVDSYQQEVYAFVLLDIGEIVEEKLTHQYNNAERANVLSTEHYKTQLATFYVGDDWLGFKSEKVMSAVSVDKLVPIHGKGPSLIAGYILYRNESIPLLNSKLLMGEKYDDKKITEAVVINISGKLVALSVDGLGEMLDVDPMTIQAVGGDVAITSKVVKQVVLSNPDTPHDRMLQMMDVDLIEREINALAKSQKLAEIVA
jgi:chemotaxis signal transduction protein